jgi:hypothetical protein
MSLVILVVVPVGVGLLLFWRWLVGNEPDPAQRTRSMRRFALVWAPSATLLIVVVELLARD